MRILGPVEGPVSKSVSTGDSLSKVAVTDTTRPLALESTSVRSNRNMYVEIIME